MSDVTLVDIYGDDTGSIENLIAHEQGLLHRAFSIFVFNDEDELLLQRRSEAKNHSSGLWSNTCCSHPLPGEHVIESAHKRLQEEMGFDCELKELFCLTYKAPMSDGTTEYEYDHILAGRSNATPIANPIEVQEWKWVPVASLCEDILRFPDQYTKWLKLIIRIRVTKLLRGIQ